MRLIDSYWTDDEGNRWDSLLFSEEEAKYLSEMLKICGGCKNCGGCRNYSNFNENK